MAVFDNGIGPRGPDTGHDVQGVKYCEELSDIFLLSEREGGGYLFHMSGFDRDTVVSNR